MSNDPGVFTGSDREMIRAALVAGARADSRIVAAAHLGSFAVGTHDRWSDIDLALPRSTRCSPGGLRRRSRRWRGRREATAIFESRNRIRTFPTLRNDHRRVRLFSMLDILTEIV